MTKTQLNGARGFRQLRERLPGRPHPATIRTWIAKGIWPAPMTFGPGGVSIWSEEMIDQGLAELRRRGEQRYAGVGE